MTAASTLAGWRFGGERLSLRYAVILLTGGLALGAGPATTLAQSAPVARAVAADPHGGHIVEASQRFGIPEQWIRAVLRAESAGDVRAISSAGAIGLMQVMPDTWAGLRVRYRLGRDPYDPRDNILAGTAYLREMWDRYGNVAAMLAAYNAGPGRYDEHRATGRPLPAETRTYVAALAQALGGAVAAGTPEKQSAPPPDWRDAPLFVMRPSERRAADPVQTIGTSGVTRPTVPVRERRDAEQHNGSMFVAHADDGRAP
ncbi:lytic transglycosylase domain-containing protein [Brucella anthropi]|uniref:lytic transglycosylase domain-containing protein n=1 Tax=Brucella anthropi TaxID=529 RepID=UPI0023625096|nr:lytic transglycosylase domain-containing protein [Brucella anthropi]